MFYFTCSQVTILGTPGEDCGCGSKVDMVNKAVFDEVDFCMMLSPYNNNLLFPRHNTMVCVTVDYKGKAAHASACPWEGRNALDAAVACYSNIALLRQQLKSTWNINGLYACLVLIYLLLESCSFCLFSQHT